MTSQKMKIFTFIMIILLTIMFTSMASATDCADTNNSIASDNSQQLTTQTDSTPVDIQDNINNINTHEKKIIKNSEQSFIEDTSDKIDKITKNTNIDYKNIKGNSTEQYTTTITLDELTGTHAVGNPINITGRISVPGLSNLENFPIDIYVNNTLVDHVFTYQNGEFVATYTPTTLIHDFAQAKYEGSPNYLASESNFQVVYVQYNLTLTIDDMEDSYRFGDDITVKGRISGYGADGLQQNDLIYLYENDEEVGSYIFFGSETSFEISYTPTSVGNKTLVLKYFGDNEYLDSVSNEKYILVRYNTSLEYISVSNITIPDSIELIGSFLTSNKNDSELFDIDIYINDEKVDSISVKSNNYFGYKYTVLLAGNYTLYLKFEGNDYYMPVTSTIRSFKVFYNTSITLDEVTVNHGQNQAFNLTGRFTHTGSIDCRGFPIKLYAMGEDVNLTVFPDENGYFAFDVTPIDLGPYEVKAVYEGTDEYLSSTSNIVSFDIYKPVEVILLISTYNYSIITMIIGHDLRDDTLLPIDIYVNDLLLDSLAVSRMVFYNFTVPSYGTYNIYAKFESDDVYADAISPIQTIVITYPTNITLDELNDTYITSTPINIRGQINTIENVGNGDFPIDIYVNDEKIGRAYSSQTGRYEYLFTPTHIGNYTIKTQYGGNDNFNGSTSTPQTITVYSNSIITLDEISETTIINNPITITGKIDLIGLSNYDDYPLNIYINGINQNSVNISSNGSFRYEFIPTLSGNYTVLVNHSGNDSDLPSTSNPISFVVFSNTTITLDELEDTYLIQQPITINGKIISEGDSSYDGFPIDILINGEKVGVVYTPESGLFDYTFTPTYAGNYTIEAQYPGGPKHLSSSDTKTFKVMQNTTITLDELEDTYLIQQPITIEGKIISEGDSSYDGFSIDILINGEKVERLYTPESGLFDYTFTPTYAGNYVITVKYEGNDKYIASNVSKILTVVSSPNIIINPVEQVNLGQTLTIEGRVVDTNNNPMANQTIVLSLDENVMDSTTTTSEGIFTFELTPTLTGTFIYKIKCQNTSEDIEITVMDDTTPTLVVDSITTSINDIINITAKITAGTNIITDINTGKVVFKVNGKTLKDTNGKVIYAKVINGTATIENYEVPEEWSKDETSIEAIYYGSKQYDKLTSQKTDITLTPKELTLTTSDIITQSGSTITLTAALSDTTINNGKIIFKIDGKTVKDASGKIIYAKVVNGSVSVEFNIPETMIQKDYTLTAIYIPINGDKLEDKKTITITA